MALFQMKVSKPDPREKRNQAPDKQQIIDWYNKYYKSPFFKQQLYDKGNGGFPNQSDAVSKETLEGINNLTYTFDDQYPSGNRKLTQIVDRNINMGDPNFYENQSRSSALAHEVGHYNGEEILAHQPRNLFIMLDRNNARSTGPNRKNDAKYMLEKASENIPRYSDGTPMYNFPTTGDYRLSNLRDWTLREANKSVHGAHDNLVTEQRADIMALRYLAAKYKIWDAAENKPGSFTPEMLDKLYKLKEVNTPRWQRGWQPGTTQQTLPSKRSLKKGDLPNVAPPKKPGLLIDRLRSTFNDSDLLYLINNLAKNNPTQNNQNILQENTPNYLKSMKNTDYSS